MRRIIYMLIAALYLICSPLLSMQIQAADNGTLYSFGDSAIDTGNIFILTQEYSSPEPLPPYWNGRFSNGPNYLDWLAQAVPGWESDAYMEGGPNAAFGAAQSGSGTILGGVPNVGEQIEVFQIEMAQEYMPHDMVLLSMGHNDLFANVASPPTSASIVDSMMTNLQMVHSNGATRIIVPTVFPLHLMPQVVNNEIPVATAQTKVWVEALNSEMNARISRFQTENPEVTIIRTDITSHLTDLCNNPAKYGLTLRNVTDSAYTGDFFGEGGETVENPNQYLWWDGVAASAAHVTANVQKLIARWILSDTQSALYPEQAPPQSGLASISVSLSRSNDRNQWEADHIYSLLAHDSHFSLPNDLDSPPSGVSNKTSSFYFMPTGSFGRQSSSGNSAGWTWTNAGFTLGGDYQFSPGLFGGIALGYSNGRIDLQKNAGEANNDIFDIRLYGGLSRDRFYLIAGAQYAITSNEIDRRMSLLEKKATSDFNTYLFGAQFETGLIVSMKSMNISPLVGFSFSHLDHGDGAETGGGLLNYDNIDYRSSNHIRHKLGLRISGEKKFSNDFKSLWRADSAWHYEYLDNGITAKTELAGIKCDYKTPDKSRHAASLSVSQQIEFKKNAVLNLAYRTMLGGRTWLHSLNASINIKF